MFDLRRRALSQNFLKSRKLVTKLTRHSSIDQNDIVLEIGPGRGIITEELIRISNKVIAVELDTNLYFNLQKKFGDYRNKLTLINKDFLQYTLPEYSYKVFANIPFSIEGKIIRKLLDAQNSPQDCYLVVRKDLAERLSGFKIESQFSIFYKPWFTFEIVHYFNRYDYEPAATMDTVLLRFTKKEQFLLSDEEKTAYINFVSRGFGGGGRLKYNLHTFLTDTQFKRLAQDNHFPVHCRPSELNLSQWLALFNFFQRK